MKFSRQDYQDAADGKIPWPIPEDEPVFLLRAQDPAAVEAVFAYLQFARSEGVSQEFLQSVLQQAKAMTHWPKKKTPDLPEVSK